jgi:hypothetical protein
MTDKKDDVAGKIMHDMFPEISESEMVQNAMKHFVKNAGAIVGCSLRGMQELMAWQTFAAAAASKVPTHNETRFPNEVVDYSIHVADNLLIHWKNRRDEIERKEKEQSNISMGAGSTK